MKDVRPVLGMINENTSGHATFHRQLVQSLDLLERFKLQVVNTPRPSLLRRLLTSPWPLPQGWDFDIPLFRNQVGQSIVTRQALRALAQTSDVLHIYSQNASPLNLDLVRGRPLVITSDGTCRQTSGRFSYRYPGRGGRFGRTLAESVENRFIRHASLVVAQSDWARRSFIEDVGVPPARIHTIRVGAQHPAPVRERIDDGVARVLFVGASMLRKGGYRLMDALKANLSEKLELHLVTKAPVRPTPHVIVHSDIVPGDGRIQTLLDECDVFAFPSDMDMSPNAIFEAMAHGLPVVAYRSGGIPEMVDDGVSGFLLEEGDMGGVAAAVMRLVGDRSLARELGEQGRQLLKQRFDPLQNATEFADAVESSCR